MGKVIITKRKNHLLLLLMENHKPSMLQTTAALEEESILGNIYLAKVKDTAPGMKAVFVRISSEKTVFLPMSECREVLLANRDYSGSLKQGDEVVIQITGEAQKTKQPSASAALSVTGQYCVCNYFGHGIQYSKKLSEEKKEEIRAALKEAGIKDRKSVRFTIRTNAGTLKEFTPLFEEMKKFIGIFRTISETYRHRTCFTCFYQTEPEILLKLKGIPLTAYDEIVTDESELCALLQESLPQARVRFYQDDLLSLEKLYSIETHLEEALSRKVWLPCGGYLIIEPTEAMVVIDVNSGKSEGKGKKSESFYYKVNEEAAREIARQLRLRNYSGMIMVDFINMTSGEDNERLLNKLDHYLKEDLVRTRLVDMTALGIVEITRKKVSKPLDRSIL